MTDREAFEAWAIDQGFPIKTIDIGDDLDYLDLRTQGAWDSWQAATEAKDSEISTLKTERDAQLAIYDKAIDNLQTKVNELVAALNGVIRVADRKTDEFDAARAAIAKAEGRTE